MQLGESKEMAGVSKYAEADVPLGIIGRLFGLRVIDPELQAGEQLCWSARANRMQRRVRAVGGRLYLTDRRLIFGCSKLEGLLGGKEWSAPLVELASATPQDRVRTIHVGTAGGGVERFVIGSKQESAEIIDRAIREAD
jgi:hypothetical protein